MFRADLHVHTTHSDGSFSPEEVLSLAKEKNLQALSITDHDTLAAYTGSLFQLAKSLDIKLLVGVEISSEFQNESIHVLA